MEESKVTLAGLIREHEKNTSFLRHQMQQLPVPIGVPAYTINTPVSTAEALLMRVARDLIDQQPVSQDVRDLVYDVWHFWIAAHQLLGLQQLLDAGPTGARPGGLLVANYFVNRTKTAVVQLHDVGLRIE